MRSNLKMYLSTVGISVNQLHKMSGISRTTLDPLAKNDTVPPKTRIETLQKIAKVLDVNINELFYFEESTKIMPINNDRYFSLLQTEIEYEEMKHKISRIIK